MATALEEGAGIRLSWRASRYDADGGELTGLWGYVIFRASSGSSERAAVDTVSWERTEYVDGDLAAAVVYTYALMAVDGSGNGSELTPPVSATTRGLAPPSGLSAASGIGRITVAWSGSNEAELIGYNVYRSERSDGGFERLSGSEGTPFTTGQTTYIDTGFVGGEIFFYRVSVVTSQGESELSEFAGATVESDSRPPAAPTFLSGEAVVGDPEVILLEWRPPSSDVGGAELTGLSGYLVFRADSPSGPFREIGTSETAKYRDSGLEQRTTYYYQVQGARSGRKRQRAIRDRVRHDIRGRHSQEPHALFDNTLRPGGETGRNHYLGGLGRGGSAIRGVEDDGAEQHRRRRLHGDTAGKRHQ